MRLFEIDALRGYALLFVLIRHFSIMQIIGLSQYLSLTLFSVPVFIFISGLVLAYNYRKRKFGIKNFYKKRFFHIGIPYLIWAAIFTIIYERPFTDPSKVLLKYLYRTATGGWFTLWFVFVLFQFYMLFPLLIKLYDLMSPIYHKLLIIIKFIFCLYDHYLMNYN